MNGPGESKQANVGISLPGSGERPVAPVYIDGEKTVTLKGEAIAEEFQRIVEDYVRRTYGPGGKAGAPACTVVIRWNEGQVGREGSHPFPSPRSSQVREDRPAPSRRAAISAEQHSRMNSTIQGVRGMNDILPDEAALWERFEDVVRSWVRAYGYRNIRTPLVEHTALFRRAIGEATDIVEKEMYSFVDELNGEHLTLRRKRLPRSCARRRAFVALRRSAASLVQRAHVPA